ncbi:MAG: hypothetical protein IIU80_03520, partial [Clostridia bacterium]|nr:hypothetical protein [Clostridia bacterium]
MSGFITQSINGVEAEADSNPNLLARIWAKVREWADKIHTHDNKKTLDQLYCKALEDMFSQGDDDGYLRFRGDKLRPVSDGVVIKEVEEVEKEGAKFLRLSLHRGDGLSNNFIPDFIDIPVSAIKEVEEENPGFDFTLNGSELELPTGSADPNDFVGRDEFDEFMSGLDERIVFNATLGEMAVKQQWTETEHTVVSLEPTIYYNFGEVESLTLDFAEIHDAF